MYYTGVATAFTAAVLFDTLGKAGFVVLAVLALLLMAPASAISFTARKAKYGRPFVVQTVIVYSVGVGCIVAALVTSGHTALIALVGFSAFFGLAIAGRRFGSR